MDFDQVTRTRRTVSNFTDQRVSDAVVDDALALSLWAPNHRLTHPIRYVDVGPRARAALADLAVELKSARGPLGDPQRAAIHASVLKPSHLIMLALNRNDQPTVAYEDYATLACGVQIATTRLWAEGIATKWSTAGWTTAARTYDILGLDFASVKLEGSLMIGYPATVPRTPPRPDLTRVRSTTD